MRLHNIKENIIGVIKKKNNIVTTTEISKELNISWNTAEKHLLELALMSKIKSIKKSGVNLWVLK